MKSSSLAMNSGFVAGGLNGDDGIDADAAMLIDPG